MSMLAIVIFVVVALFMSRFVPWYHRRAPSFDMYRGLPRAQHFSASLSL